MINMLSMMLTVLISTSTIVNLGDFLVISHRGVPSEAPVHTFKGYDLAIEQGSSYMGQEVFLSKDGYVVVSKDIKMAKDKKITEMTLEEIKEFKTDGEPYYTLDEVFERYGNQVNYVIENKITNDEYTLEKTVLEIVGNYGLENNVIFQSFFSDSLWFYKNVSSGIPRMLLVEKNRNIDILVDFDHYNYVDAIALESKMLDEEKVNELQDAGFKVFAYFISEPKKEVKRVISLGVNGIFTHYTESLLNLVGASM